MIVFKCPKCGKDFEEGGKCECGYTTTKEGICPECNSLNQNNSGADFNFSLGRVVSNMKCRDCGHEWQLVEWHIKQFQ